MERRKNLPESYPMIGGDGPHSYSLNSTYQKQVIDNAKEMINKAIQDRLEFSSPGFCENSKTFNIADFGCSIGPNTFIAMQNIIESVELKYHADHQQNHPPLEFQVFFNDHTNNDFNTLFKNLPPSSKYFAAGVPGGFHKRLFPKSTLHLGHCSYALHWLSNLPKEVMDAKSPAWNKDSIYYTGYANDAAKAYSEQFKNDMENFLNARAQELVGGGLMLIVIPALHDGLPCSETVPGINYELLGSSLRDMAKLGLISEEKLEAFNLPMYHPTVEELEMLVKKNECFSVERMDTIDWQREDPPSVEFTTSSLRAVMEELIKKHFGNEIVDPLFECFAKKLSANYATFVNKPQPNSVFILLKRIVV